MSCSDWGRGSGDAASLLVVCPGPECEPLRTELERAGHDVTLAETCQQALMALRCGGIGAVLVDLDLPEREVAAVVTEVGDRWPHMPVVALAEGSAAGRLASAVDRGIRGALIKPVHAKDALLVIRRAALRLQRQTESLRKLLCHLRELNHDLMGPLQVLDMQLALALEDGEVVSPTLLQRVEAMRAALDRLVSVSRGISSGLRAGMLELFEPWARTGELGNGSGDRPDPDA